MYFSHMHAIQKVFSMGGKGFVRFLIIFFHILLFVTIQKTRRGDILKI